jgi:hypothetical protein
MRPGDRRIEGGFTELELGGHLSRERFAEDMVRTGQIVHDYIGVGFGAAAVVVLAAALVLHLRRKPRRRLHLALIGIFVPIAVWQILYGFALLP